LEKSLMKLALVQAAAQGRDEADVAGTNPDRGRVEIVSAQNADTRSRTRAARLALIACVPNVGRRWFASDPADKLLVFLLIKVAFYQD
jgi:hypothetical protein